MNISEFERNKPKETYKKMQKLKKLIQEEQDKTELLYKNRIATLDHMLLEIESLIKTFKEGK